MLFKSIKKWAERLASNKRSKARCEDEAVLLSYLDEIRSRGLEIAKLRVSSACGHEEWEVNVGKTLARGETKKKH